MDRAVTLTESTSPNSLLFASLDAARRQAAVHGRELLEHTMAALAERARADPRDRRPRRARRAARRAARACSRYDPLRLAVDVRGIAASGYELAPLLREIDDINLELYGQNVIVAVFGMGERGMPEAAAARAARCARRRGGWALDPRGEQRIASPRRRRGASSR